MKRYSLVFAFLFVIISNVSWAGVEGRVKCGETTVIYTNFANEGLITVLVTDKCVGLDSAIIIYDAIEDKEIQRLPVPDGQSTSATFYVLRQRGIIKLECNGNTGKGSCSFAIIDVKQ